jgi:penicillin-binding protein 3
LPIGYPFYKSQVANKNLSNQVLLADSGYGQGEVLVSPLHIAMFYSALSTNGDILTPILEIQGKAEPSVWKPQAIDEANVPLLTSTLIQVVENPVGTGYTKIPAKTRMLGKTGTAQIKTDQQGVMKENGWFVAMNTENPRLCIAMMIENVQDRGGSHYVVPLVKQAMDELMLLLPAD